MIKTTLRGLRQVDVVFTVCRFVIHVALGTIHGIAQTRCFRYGLKVTLGEFDGVCLLRVFACRCLDRFGGLDRFGRLDRFRRWLGVAPFCFDATGRAHHGAEDQLRPRPALERIDAKCRCFVLVMVR